MLTCPNVRRPLWPPATNMFDTCRHLPGLVRTSPRLCGVCACRGLVPGDPVFLHLWGVFFIGTIIVAVSIQWGLWFAALCRLQEGSTWVSKCMCCCTAMCLCVVGVCWPVDPPFCSHEGIGWLIAATCVPWYVPRGNSGLCKQALNQKPVLGRGGGVHLSNCLTPADTCQPATAGVSAEYCSC